MAMPGHEGMEHVMSEDGTMVMVMDGIPAPLFAGAVALVVILSFVAIEWRGLSEAAPRSIEITRRGRIRRLMSKPWFRFAFQAPILAGFLFTIYAGLFGSFSNNIAPVLVWTIWWAGLIFAIALFGNAWCFVCPWDALSDLATKLSFWRHKTNLSLGLKWPTWLKNVYPAVALFVVLTWLEIGFGVTQNPRQTAYMGLGMAVTAMGFALTFEKKLFCRSFCFVGRISGMYSMFSPVELRARDTRACDVCTTHDCLNGNDAGPPCPTDLDLSEVNESTYCTLCTACVRSCTLNQPTVNIRSLARDLSRVKTPRMDEAWLALILLTLTAFHGFSMTPLWKNLVPGTPDFTSWLEASLSLGKLGAFTVGMIVICLVPVVAYALITWLATLWVRGSGVGYRDLFVQYAYTLLPVALFYHLAHNAMHLLMEGQDVVAAVSDPLGRGADWFGTASWTLPPILGQEPIWFLQVGLVLTGHVFGIAVTHRISRRLFPDRGTAIRSSIPMLVMMVALSAGGLWLMSLDMNMRMGRM